jgi:hypothetical protein
VNFKKYLVTPATARCCGYDMHRQYQDVLLREPAMAFRMHSYVCQVCRRIGVTEQDIAQNAHRALRVAKFVKPPTDWYRVMEKELRDNKVSHK